MNARPNLASKGSNPGAKRARLAAVEDGDKENQESAESNLRIDNDPSRKKSSVSEPTAMAKKKELLEKLWKAIESGRSGKMTIHVNIPTAMLSI
jgi:hypothetical protein